MEKLYYPKNSYFLTQGYGDNSYSHQGRFALDVSAAGGGYKEIYAPFTGYIARVYASPGKSYTCFLVSNNKVMCADKKARYVVIMMIHPDEIINFKVGQVFKQGEFMMNDGATGFATGKHLDFEIAVYDNKKDIDANWYKTNRNTWGLKNAVNPLDHMIMKNDCKILKETYLNKTYRFIKENETATETYKPGLYQTLGVIRVRTGPGKTYMQKRVKDLTVDGKKNATSKNLNALAYYRYGTLFDALDIIKYGNNNIWAKGYSGYINIIDGSDINSEKV